MESVSNSDDSQLSDKQKKRLEKKKRKSKKHENECSLDHSNREDVGNCDADDGHKFVDEKTTSKTEKSAMREKSGVQNVEDSTTEGESVQNVEKTKKKKKNKKGEVDQDALEAEGVDKVEVKTKKRKKKKISSDHLTDGETASKDLTSKIEDSATDGKSVHTKEKNKKSEVDQDALGAEDVSKVEVKTKKRKKKKTISSDHKTDGETTSKDLTSTIDDSATDVKSVANTKEKDKKREVDQDALGAGGVSNLEAKTKKRKKKISSDHKTDGETTSKDLTGIIEDSDTDGKSVQNVESTREKDKKGEVHQKDSKAEVKTKKKKKSSDHKTDGETASKELAAKIEDSATDIENTKEIDKKGEVHQEALGAEVASKAEVKTKKRKNSPDHNTDNIEKNDDVSLPKNNDEPEFDREKPETTSSSSVLIDNNVAQEVASAEIEVVPRCSCEGKSTKKLVVFDLNGILADIVKGPTGQYVPDGRVSYRSIFRRPFLASFLDFCFERFAVGIWTSRHIGLDYMINTIMRNHARNMLFCFGQDMCITTKFKTQENSSKPLFLKNLSRVWDQFGTCFTCGKQKYDETNTLLVDDSPDKALCNPPNTGIFPFPYQFTNCSDSALGSEGELRKYLERLADSTNVQKFVAENPIGQTAITERHESWRFYSKVIEAHRKPSTSLLPM